MERQEAEEVPLGRFVRVTAMAVVIGSMMVASTDRVAGAVTGGGSQASDAARVASSGRSRRGGPELKSNVALVIDAARGETLYAKHSDQVAPIASITKLMTAMVVLDAQCPLDEAIEIDRADVDTRKHTRSRLPVGARLGRGELLWVALMASENRAATALARTRRFRMAVRSAAHLRAAVGCELMEWPHPLYDAACFVHRQSCVGSSKRGEAGGAWLSFR